MNPKNGFLFYFAFIIIILTLAGCDLNIINRGYRDYYLDAERGNDRYIGTSPDKPWKSLDRLKKVRFNPGDNIHLNARQRFTGNVSIKDIKSTSDNPFTIISTGGGRAVIEAGDSTGIRFENCDYVVIRNINVAGSGRRNGNNGNGIELKNVSHGDIDSVNASGFIWSGILVSGGNDIGITHAYVHNNGFSGINVESGEKHDFKTGSEYKTMHNLYIGYCIAENNPGCPLVTDNHSGNGILIGGVTGGVIEYCEAMNNGWDMPRDGNGPVGIWAYMCDSILIQQCYSHHNRTSEKGKDGGGFDLDGGVTNSIMQYNHSAFNEGAGYGLYQYNGAAEWNNNTVRYNTSLNDGSKNGHAGIQVWSDPAAIHMKGCTLYNNIIINDQGHAVRFEPGTYLDFNFENNIFTLTGANQVFVDGDFKGANFDNNQYWSFYNSTRNLRQPDIKYDPDPVFSEPLLDMPMMKD